MPNSGSSVLVEHHISAGEVIFRSSLTRYMSLMTSLLTRCETIRKQGKQHDIAAAMYGSMLSREKNTSLQRQQSKQGVAVHLLALASTACQNGHHARFSSGLHQPKAAHVTPTGMAGSLPVLITAP